MPHVLDWISIREACAHIRSIEGCDAISALKRLRSAVRDGKISADQQWKSGEQVKVLRSDVLKIWSGPTGAVKTCYSEAQFKDDILKTFSHSPGFRKRKFREQLERAAWFFAKHKTEEDPLSKPSEQIRHFKSMGSNARHFKSALSDAGGNFYLAVHLREAALSLARRRDRVPPPDFKQPELIVYNHPDEPVAKTRHQIERQFQVVRRAVEWFCRVVDEAERRVSAEIRKAGNRPDEALHEFARSIAELYLEAAANPRPPTRVGADEGRGEFLNLLAACLQPLGETRERRALFELCYRAGVLNMLRND